MDAEDVAHDRAVDFWVAVDRVRDVDRELDVGLVVGDLDLLERVLDDALPLDAQVQDVVDVLERLFVVVLQVQLGLEMEDIISG